MPYPKTITRRPRKTIWCLYLCGVLTGCASPLALDQAFIGYAETYATIVNEQMLLNLARRANNHPPYFLQLGSINSQFTFGVGLNNTGTFTKNSAFPFTAAARTMSVYSGMLSLNASESPVFAITPLSGSTFGNAIYKPVDIRIFYEQLAHGVPMDMLLRLMVHSVWLEFSSGKILALTNVPDLENPLPFRNYLRLAARFRELQKAGALVVDQNEKGESSLVFTARAPASFERLRKDHRYDYWEGLKDLRGEAGFSKITFITRSFVGVLSAMGQEQDLFEKWEKKYSPAQTVNSVPAGEYRPIIKLVWSDNEKTTPPLVEASYFGSDYKIADPDDGSSWNRDAFSLLASLFELVSMDPKSLPLQQLIQVR
ncbi:MAG: hypothetical protein ACRERV_06810 [Methylococcales bacterium]